MIDYIVQAFPLLLSWQNLIFINLGMALGIVFGAIPGLNGNLAITVLLPLTFSMDTVPALLMLTAIYFGANFGGSISAILINTPGTGNATVTILDGYPMAKKGKPRKALDMALTASTFGGLFSALCLLFFAPQLSKVALKIGSAEYFMLAVFGLTIIAFVSGDSIIHGVISAALGIFISTIGSDSVSGLTRFTFGNIKLMSGIKMMAVMLGMFAISQMIERILGVEEGVMADVSKKNSGDVLTLKEVKSTVPTMLKSSAIGAVVGAVPGTGGGIASFIAYNEAQRCAKKGEKFGEGELKGIAAPESANNGSTCCTLIPLLTLGIPGDVVAATLMGALTMHGLIVGPRLFVTSGTTVYAILIGCVITQIFMFLQGKYLLRTFVKITHIPKDLLTALLVVVCCTGAFTINNSVVEVVIMIISGIAAYFMKKIELPTVPLVLGLVLGPTAEKHLRNMMVVSNGSWLYFFKRPVCLVLLALIVFLLVFFRKNQNRNENV